MRNKSRAVTHLNRVGNAPPAPPETARRVSVGETGQGFAQSRRLRPIDGQLAMPALTKSILDWVLLGANPVRPAGCFCGLSLTAPTSVASNEELISRPLPTCISKRSLFAVFGVASCSRVMTPNALPPFLPSCRSC